MTNYERLVSLTEEEMAWFLMAYSDPCRTCIHKRFREDTYGHKYLEEYPCKDHDGIVCLKETEKWLNRENEEDEDDVFIFDVCRHNIEVGIRNKETERRNFEILYAKGEPDEDGFYYDKYGKRIDEDYIEDCFKKYEVEDEEEVDVQDEDS